MSDQKEQTAPARRSYTKGASSSKKSSAPSRPAFKKFEDSELLAANAELALAFQMIGLMKGIKHYACPSCGTESKNKVVLKRSQSGASYWKCYKCGEHGSAIKLLQSHGGYSYPDAVNSLLGRPTSSKVREIPERERVKTDLTASFQAVVDIDVYDAIRASGSLAAAQKYYMTIAHISPEAVEECGSTYILNARAVQAELVKKFGMERLKAAGVTTTGKEDKEFFLFSDDYCVIEPHERACVDLRRSWRKYEEEAAAAVAAGETPPEKPFSPPSCKRTTTDGHGHVVGMQFRPSLAQKKKVTAHKKWKARWGGLIDPETGVKIDPTDAWQEVYDLAPERAGPKEPYVTPFLSLKGATPQSLVGCGLRRISGLTPGENIEVVEGFKDVLAARTMGFEAYAIPGTGVMPGPHICELLGQHVMLALLDGDAAGAAGREELMKHFEEQGVYSEESERIREGLDVADMLVEKHALAGCACNTCIEWRSERP